MAHRFQLGTVARLIVLLLVIQAQSLFSADWTVKTSEAELPKELGDSIRQVLTKQSVQLVNGDTAVCQFWFRDRIPLKSKAESSEAGLKAIPETTLIGAVAVHATQRDYKDNEIAPGLYTLRYAFQPSDGDHLGTADYSYFLVLISAKNDSKLDGITAYKPMVKASGKETSSGHPLILSLRPAGGGAAGSLKISEPAPDHKSVLLKVPTSASDSGAQGELLFELVFVGKGKT